MMTINETVNLLLNPDNKPRIFEHTLSEFEEIYQRVKNMGYDSLIDVVLNGDWCMIQFSYLCNYRIIIKKEFNENAFRIRKNEIFKSEDFSFAHDDAHFYGTTERITFGNFIIEELSSNWIIIVFSFGFTILCFWLMVFSSSGLNGLTLINETIISASALFLSIFVLFSISQNSNFYENSYLFRIGLSDRFFRIDKLIATLSIFPLFLSIFIIAIIHIPIYDVGNKFQFSIPFP